MGDALGERGKCDGVRSEIGFAVAIADHQRRAEPRADQQVGVLAEQYGERKGTAQALQRTADRLFRRRARLDLAADEMGGPFGIGLRFNAAPAGLHHFPRSEVPRRGQKGLGRWKDAWWRY